MTEKTSFPSYIEVLSYEEKANALRAEAIRNGFSTFVAMIAGLPAAIANALRPTAHG